MSRIWLLLSGLIAITMAAPGPHTASPAEVREHMQRKRAFDRVKHNPGPLEGPPPDHEDDDLLDYTGADGVTRKISRDDMVRRLQQQQEDFPSLGQDGKMTKTQQGKARVDELREKDPRLAHLIDVAEAAVERLKELGHASGKLQHLTTVDDHDEVEAKMQALPEGGFYYRLELTIKPEDETKAARRFQVTIESGKGLTEAWRVKKDGSRVLLEVPEETGGASPVGRLGLVMLGVGIALVLGGLVAALLGGTGKEGSGAETRKKE